MEQKKHEILKAVQSYLLKQARAPQEETVLYITTCGKNRRGHVWRTSGRDFERAWVKVERYFSKMPELIR